MGAIINTRRYFALTALSIGISFTAQAANTSTYSEAVLEEVVVTGLRANLNQSIQVKQAEDHIVEVIAADNMGQLPNVTVAESLVRLPGVNGARDRGNESLATVRGLGPRMTMGTVNGREVASSEPTRAVRWEVFPTEVVSTVKVYKTQSADLIAGGIAATIDIGTINPLDYKGPAFVATGGAVYYDEGKDVPNYSPWGDRMGLSWVGKINDNFGIALGGTYQKQKNANALMGGWGYTSGSDCKDINGDGSAECTPWGAADELKQIDQTRLGATAILQWRIDNFEMKFDSLYSKVKIRENQNQTWFQHWDYAFHPSVYNGASYTVVDGDVVAATFPNYGQEVDHVIGKYQEDKDLTALGWNGKWTSGDWTTAADFSYSKANRASDWRALKFGSNPAALTFDFSDGATPSISTSSDTVEWGLGATADGPEQLHDKITALAANTHRDLEGGFLKSVEFGARYADRTKNHSKYTQSDVWSSQPFSAFNGMYYYFAMPDLNVPAMVGGDFDAIAQTGFGGWDNVVAQASSQESLLEHWQVQEKVKEAYVKGVYESTLFGTRVTGNVGVRVVGVDTTSTGYDQIGGVNTAVVQGKTYTDVLPSAIANFMLTDEKILRVALAKVVARPPLDELRTGRSLSNPATTTGQLTGSGANPSLDPFRAKQLDVSYEWYFHSESLLAVSTYRKWVDSSIGYKSGHQIINGSDYLITGPFNGGGGYIDGVELTFQTPFYFIPGMENFGVYSNYSYVDSNLKEFSPDNKPLPLSGLARNTTAIDLWYSNKKFEARLGYKFHSPYTVIYGWTESALSRLESESIFDFSTSYQFTDMFGLKMQVGNLTNEKLRTYVDNKPDRLANKDATGGYQAFGRRYSLEATVKF